MVNKRICRWLLAGLMAAAGDAAADNQPPIANAGPDQTTYVGETVVLDGSGSTDADGDSLSFSWSVSNAPVGVAPQIGNPTAVRPTILLPADGSYSIQLVVSDGVRTSAPAIVTLNTSNSTPVADAGADQSVSVGSQVLLDGSKSTDVDGDGLTYEWSLGGRPSNSTATLLNADPESPTADFIVDQAGRYTAHLTVRDAESVSTADATIASTENSAPEANAGNDLATTVGEWVALTGSSSVDADYDPLSYRWSLTKPPGSTATLSETTDFSTGFVPDVPGTYVAQLIVNDGAADSAPDTVVISTENSRPIAWAYAEIYGSAYVDEASYLIGYYSYDPDGDPLSYQWSMLSAPLGSSAAIAFPQSHMGPFTPDVVGKYVLQLIVSDGSFASDPVTVAFEAAIRPPPPEPVIYVDPIPGSVNSSPFLLTGHISEPAQLWINEQPVAVDSDNHFSYELDLSQGQNYIDFYALDADGYSGYAYLDVELDTQAPAEALVSDITVEAQSDGRLIVRGAASSAELNATLRVTNERTGETVSAEIASDGSFTVEINGVESDNLSIVVEDRAHNTSPTAVIPGIGAGPLNVSIVAPLDSATIQSNTVVVRGSLSGPVDAGVSVNGEPAIVLENGATRTFSALVSLTLGANTIIATATRPNGESVTAQVQVTSASSTAFEVTAAPASGPAPLSLMFHIREFSEDEIARTDIDLQNDGSVDIETPRSDRYIPATYTQAGYFEARVVITTKTGQVTTSMVPVSVQTNSQLDLQIQRTWSAIREALQNADATTALQYFTADAAERYGPVFEQIGVSELPSVAAALTTITIGKVSGRLVECVLIRNVSGADQAFLVSFSRGGDGVWRLSSL